MTVTKWPEFPPPFWRQTRSQLRSVQKEKVISSCTSLIMPMGHTLKVTTLKVDHAYCKYPRDISFSDMQIEPTNQHLQLPNPLEETSQTFPAKCSERFSCRRANPYQCNQFSQEIPREQGNLPTSLESTFEQGKEIITQRVQVTSQDYSWSPSEWKEKKYTYLYSFIFPHKNHTLHWGNIYLRLNTQNTVKLVINSFAH